MQKPKYLLDCQLKTGSRFTTFADTAEDAVHAFICYAKDSRYEPQNIEFIDLYDYETKKCIGIGTLLDSGETTLEPVPKGYKQHLFIEKTLLDKIRELFK